MWKEPRNKQVSMKLSNNSNEVTVYRVMMYVNPLLIVQAMYLISKGQSVYYSTRE